VLSGAETVVVATALLAGVTGAWSPCGFSMVDTLAPGAYAERMRATLPACATFTLGALAGGVITFGGLALLGSVLGDGSRLAAAVIALAAALGEARGARIVPQVRRQVPESWRRTMPVALAAGLYGVLLGLGFTTFILSFAVWALAGLSVALGDPALGALVGLAFGAGRALPVIALAPAARTRRGAAAHAAMAVRPGILRGLRAADALALAVCALALTTSDARAADVVAGAALNPSVAPGAVSWDLTNGQAILVRGGTPTTLPGRYPAVTTGLVAWREPDRIVVAALDTLAPVAVVPAGGVDAIALSPRWLAWRSHGPAGDAYGVFDLTAPATPPRVVAGEPAPGELGRPAVAGDALVFHVATRTGSRIDALDLTTGARTTLRTEPRALLMNPAVVGGEMVYVRSTYTRQQLRLGPLTRQAVRGDRLLYSTVPTGRRDGNHEKGRKRHREGPKSPQPLSPRPKPGVSATLWTTALDATAAYVTKLVQRRGQPLDATIVRVAR
jgi:hypothetical protein